MTCANCGKSISSPNEEYCASCKANSFFATARRVLGNKNVQDAFKQSKKSWKDFTDSFDIMKSNDD